jgi:hypothetical protein
LYGLDLQSKILKKDSINAHTNMHMIGMFKCQLFCKNLRFQTLISLLHMISKLLEKDYIHWPSDLRGHNRGFFKCLVKELSKNYVVLIDCDQWVQQCPSFMRKKSKLLRWRRYNLQQLSAWTHPDFCSCSWKDAWFNSWCYFLLLQTSFSSLIWTPTLEYYWIIETHAWVWEKFGLVF